MSNKAQRHLLPIKWAGSALAIFATISGLVWGYFDMAGPDPSLPLTHISTSGKIGLGIIIGVLGCIPITKSVLEELGKRRLKKASETYFGLIKTPEFRAWQTTVLKEIYARPEEGIKLTTLLGQAYPVVALAAEEGLKSGFDDKGIRQDLCFNTSALELNSQQKRYLRMIRPRIKYPEVPGFCLKSLTVNTAARVSHWQAGTSNYIENVGTAHALEYELVEAYRKHRGKPVGLDELPYRKSIHGSRSTMAALTQPMNYRPQISVQGMILFTHDGKRCTIAVNRNEDLAIKPGFRQIFPAGGFEAYSKDLDNAGGVFNIRDTQFQSVLKSEYSLKKTFYREMLEEIFGIQEYCYNEDDRNEGVMNHELVARIEGIKGHTFTCLGVVIDLVIMRHEFSFILDLGDEDLQYGSYHFRASSETARFLPMPLGKELKHWITESQIGNHHPLNPSTAGLLDLALRSGHYPELLKAQPRRSPRAEPAGRRR